VLARKFCSKVNSYAVCYIYANQYSSIVISGSPLQYGVKLTRRVYVTGMLPMQPVPPPPLNAEFFAEKLFKQQQKRNSVRAICAGGAATGVVDFVHIQLTSRRPTAYGHEFRDAAGVWTHV